jgi:K+ transporter
MRVDNDGEGGILALMSLLGVKRHHRPVIIAFGLFGAALIYGDGAITPAISVWIRGGAQPGRALPHRSGAKSYSG